MIICKKSYIKLINELALKTNDKGNFFNNVQKNFSLRISKDISTYIIPSNISIKRKIDKFINNNFISFINNLSDLIYERTLIRIPRNVIFQILNENKLNNYKIHDLYNGIRFIKAHIYKIQQSIESYLQKPLEFDLSDLAVPDIKFYLMLIYDLIIYLYYYVFHYDKFRKTNLVYFFWSKIFLFMIIDLSLLKDGIVDNSVSSYYYNHKNEIPFNDFPSIYNSLPSLIEYNSFKKILNKLSAKEKKKEIGLLKEMYPNISENFNILSDNIDDYKKIKAFNILYSYSEQIEFYNMENWKNTINNIIAEYSHKQKETYKYCPIFSFLPKDVKNEFDDIISKGMYIKEITYLLGVFKFFTICLDFNDRVINNFIKEYYDLLSTIDTNGEKMHAICKSCRDLGKHLFENKVGKDWIFNNSKDTYFLLFDEIKGFIEKWQGDIFSLNEKKQIADCLYSFNKYGGLVNFLQFPNINKLIHNKIDFPLGYICGRKSGASGKRKVAE